jgi:hypothetical protein
MIELPLSKGKFLHNKSVRERATPGDATSTAKTNSATIKHPKKIPEP